MQTVQVIIVIVMNYCPHLLKSFNLLKETKMVELRTQLKLVCGNFRMLDVLI